MPHVAQAALSSNLLRPARGRARVPCRGQRGTDEADLSALIVIRRNYAGLANLGEQRGADPPASIRFLKRMDNISICLFNHFGNGDAPWRTFVPQIRRFVGPGSPKPDVRVALPNFRIERPAPPARFSRATSSYREFSMRSSVSAVTRDRPRSISHEGPPKHKQAHSVRPAMPCSRMSSVRSISSSSSKGNSGARKTWKAIMPMNRLTADRTTRHGGASTICPCS